MPGAICSIFALFLVIVYAAYKVIVLVERSEYDILQELYEFKYDHTFHFGLDDGFRVAAGITGFDGNYTITEDPTIGEIKFYLKEWVEDATQGLWFTELKQRPCNDSDFEGDDAFWPLHEKFYSLKDYRKKMKCIDEPY